MGRAFSTFAAARWGQAAAGAVKLGNQPIGVSLGSGYQYYFSALSSAQQNTQIAAMKAAGISWVRMDVDWNAVQPTAGGAFDWDYPLLTIGPMLAAGINVLPILLWSPLWARAVGNNPAVPNDPYPTIAPSAFAAFCGAAAAKFGPLGISAFELWNEPNLDKGGGNSPLGLGYLSPIGYASLAVAAYAAVHAQYVPKSGGAPTPTVVGGALAGAPRLDWPALPRAGASWPAVALGAASATITCSSAVAGDLYKPITGSAVSVLVDTPAGRWPAGTYVSQVTSTGYVVSPPPWLATFPAVNASGSTTTFGLATGYPPDVFLAQAYAAAGGSPMFDALSLHPYAFPDFGSFRYVDSGSWAMVPEVRQIMVANGEGAKPIWFSELGAPTGQSLGSWPATASSAGQLTVTGDANPQEVGYLVGVAGLPLGTFVASTQPGASWTLLPPTGLTVNEQLVPGSSISALSVAAASTVSVPPVQSGGAVATVSLTDTITIPSGTTLTVWIGNGNGYYGATDNGYGMPPMTVTTTAAATLTPGASATLAIESVTVPSVLNSVISAFPAGGVIQCSANLGQTWGVSAPAAAGAVLNIIAPGVYSPWAIGPLAQSPSAICSEDQQASTVPYAFQFVASQPWPYVGPMFVYCWSDASIGNNAGPFGLTRADGTPKPALARLTAIAQTGGLSPGTALPGYTT